MASPTVPAAFLLTLALPSVGASDAVPHGPTAPVEQLAQLSFHQRIVIRFPRLPDPPEVDATAESQDASRIQEKKGPKCVPIQAIQGASVTRRDSIDLVTMDGITLRARFDAHCPALDFYRGFYMRQTEDGRVCAGRDSVRSRSGADCRIKSFKRVVRRH
ncbi:MAG: hypothetical protein WC816_13385 [Sphingomonas sp.]|jgi:hypothetical protein